jgi:endonuclease/exonuclease/phosphatase family metal-dependent hydrolase
MWSPLEKFIKLSEITLIFFFLGAAGLPCSAQKSGSHNISVAFYNCENFFDIVRNPKKEDEEFTPAGKYHYTKAIYEQKLHNIATVIQSMGGEDGPAVVGLAEVENNIVLSDLTHQPELEKRHYRYEWFDGPDPRGINVAMLYNPRYFRVLRSEPLPVDLSGTGGKSLTRDILHVYGILAGDTVHLFINHWPSRRGGEEQSSAKRAVAARVNRDAINKLMNKDPHARVILMGDLNDNPTDNSVADVLAAKENPAEATGRSLFDPFTKMYKSGMGTEAYRHTWNLFDQVILSAAFLDGKHHLRYEKAEIYKPDFIVDHYKGHEGEPHRSFVGTRWINGYSDHFPVILYFYQP